MFCPKCGCRENVLKFGSVPENSYACQRCNIGFQIHEVAPCRKPEENVVGNPDASAAQRQAAGKAISQWVLAKHQERISKMTPWQKWCLLHGAFLFGLKAAAFVGTLLAVYVIWWNVVMVSPTPTHLAQEGQTITITLENAHVYLTCGATPTALDEMIRWASSNDFDE